MLTVGLVLAMGAGTASQFAAERGAGRHIPTTAPGPATGAVSPVARIATPAAATGRAEVRAGTEPRPIAMTQDADGGLDIDSALAGAWRHHGCAVNPGNPACLTITLAAACAQDAKTPDCDSDSDGDRCTDVAEILAGFDPFDGDDCLSNRDGAPAINCLFPAGNLPCDGVPGLAPNEPDRSDCGIDIAVERALHPRNPYDCTAPIASPEPNRAFRDREAACDGCAPRKS